ncbi:uncharacterized protein LOC128240836 [Mya arenaria]|uniref:uncharacterized protein LOC128240836 n=1 Tax=Mya arenaria TaxID=6604 RepID=UPI0022E3D8B6|nr:uncharacterized protein LOC128240836 [Mya arenaria]XP_052813721.1 uncharacterized protein LOC128240836 [Mya arenaria]XP_052813723.1 uncharacterized protein LOC128240836 [Mya arenaria]
MASYKDILKEPENQNWLKGSLALRITKAGLRGLVEGDSSRVQQTIYSTVIVAKKLTAGTTCSLCQTENILKCPTKGLCSHPRNCKYHNSPSKMYRPCPSHICEDFRDEIIDVHRYNGPSWKNSKANKWCTNHWQVAKCFMPPDGYLDVTSYEDTDFNGIISVMINCTEFQQSMSFMIANKQNALTKAREIGRKIRHSPDLKVTDTDLAGYFATLYTLLTDSKVLASDKDAQEAVNKLKQLEKDALPISTEDLRELREEARVILEAGKRKLEETAETGKQELKDEVAEGKTTLETGQREVAETVETGKQELKDVVADGKTTLESGKREVAETAETGKQELKDVVADGKTTLETGKREVAETAETGKQELKDVVADGKTTLETGKREVAETAETGICQLEEVIQVGKRELGEALQQTKDAKEVEQGKDLRHRLVKYYQKQLSSAPISPLLSDKDEKLERFYVPPMILEKHHRRLRDDQQQNDSPISSYRQIFCKDEGVTNTVILDGEAGSGKSSFSAMCTIKWASLFSVSNKDSGGKGLDQGVEEDKSFERLLTNANNLRYTSGTHEYLSEVLSLSVFQRWSLQRLLSHTNCDLQDEDFFKNIEFMFHLKLRNSCESCELSDMIRDQLINIIYKPDERAAGYSTMLRVLSERKCVIIADGLDEWSHPIETKCSCSEVEDKAIPHLSPTLDATVLITSRPWRMSQNRIKDTKIDKYLQLQGVANVKLLVQKALICLNERVTEKMKYPGFFLFVSRKELEHLLSVPIVILLLVCLWFEGENESFSMCDIYAYMIDMMLRRKALPMLRVLLESTPLLRCFQQTKHVQKYHSIVLKLAELAFKKLFSSDRKSSLVFQNVDCLTPEELLFVLKSGLIRETKSQSLIRISSSFSFIHKTVQEFLAAVHIANHAGEIQRVIGPYCEEFLYSSYKSMTGSDVPPVFIYVCGLNPKVAKDMSTVMSLSMLDHPDWNDEPDADKDANFSLQPVIYYGFREAKANNVQNIQLTLLAFDFRRPGLSGLIFSSSLSDVAAMKTLLLMNKSEVRCIRIRGPNNISNEELQEVFTCSADTLTTVLLLFIAGQYDLSACSHLKHLTITGRHTSNIMINTNSLVSLRLSMVSIKVESRILQSLEQRCETLMKFEIGSVSNIKLFCRTLPKLNHLQDLTIEYSTLGDYLLLLPPSVTSVILFEVTMSAWSMRELVENCSHTVTCRIDNCEMDPIEDFLDIKRYAQTRNNICVIEKK